MFKQTVKNRKISRFLLQMPKKMVDNRRRDDYN